MTYLPPGLALRLTQLFTKEEQIFLEDALKQIKRPTSFRVNILKSTLSQIEEDLNIAHIWYELCSIIPDNIVLINNDHEKKLRTLDIYKNGEIYIQWISSQTPVTYFQKPVSNETKLKILDACAAPWGKTWQLSQYYPNAEIWAFESSKIRYDKLKYNLRKLWVNNVTCIHDSIRNISQYIPRYEYFDKILIDAPCSWEWSASYHNTKFLENWSLNHIKKNYTRQKVICDAVIPYFKTGWEMIYSTCTLAPEENEAVIHYLLCKYPWLKLEKLDFIENKYIKYKRALKSFGKYIFRKEIAENTLRVIPSRYSEGFYIAKISKWAV